MMKIAVPLLAASLLFPSCAPVAPPPVSTPLPAEPPRAVSALTPVGSRGRPLAAPVIRVGLQSDQPRVVFPRLDEGYYIVGDGGPSILKRGFTAHAPLADATVRFTVQLATISAESSAA